MLIALCIPIYIIISLLFSFMFRYIVIFCFYFRRLIAMAQRFFKIN